MALVSQQVYTGPFSISLDPELVGKIYDLAPGGKQRLRREKEGIEEVVEELAKNVPSKGADAGISAEVYGRFVDSTDALARIRAAKLVVAKLAEVLDESEAQHEHERETWIGMMVDSVKSTARRVDATIAAPFAKTLEYNARPGVKANKTRRKNAEAEASEEPADAEE